jgi:zinc/manganese transport system ATP-binding protein
MSAVSLDHVTLSLGSRIVLTDVSLEIGEREFVGMLGPNGAGKTTLMRTILGLLAPTAGTIRVLGGPAGQANRQVGYLPQLANPPSGIRLSGRDFVLSAVGGHRWGLPWPSPADRRAADRALELVGAEALAARPLADLSGGERQRILLAQALIGEPRLLLLDEPLISLDPSRQAAVIELVRRIQRDLGIAVLFSAHELNPLLGAIDRVLYLGNGQAALGEVDDVITGPILSRLYGAPIEVIRVGGRIFVMSDGADVERHDHRHEHGHA